MDARGRLISAVRPFVPSILTAAVVMACTIVVACLGLVVTSAGNDQQHFHLPTVVQIRDTFPFVDWAGLPTATGPLYHIVVAIGSGPFGFDEAGTQIIGAVFAAALAGLTVWHARSVRPAFLRALAVAPLLLSAYFWQSALWMLTDAAAALFAMGALLLLEKTLTNHRQLAVGALIALAIGTRQTYVWLLGPACIIVLAAAGQRAWPVVKDLFRVAVPGVTVLVGLISLWGGLTPPSAREYNAAALSMTAIPFVFAIAAFFSVPIVLALGSQSYMFRHWRSAAMFGLLVALPAIVWTSTATVYPNSARRGGFLWSAVAHLPAIDDRSLFLIALSFVGGFACALMRYALPPRLDVLLSSALLSLAGVTIGGAQLFPKYAELPIGVMAVVALVALIKAGRVTRIWPLFALAVYQGLMVTFILLGPMARSYGG